jgi:hypothetical protein
LPGKSVWWALVMAHVHHKNDLAWKRSQSNRRGLKPAEARATLPTTSACTAKLALPKTLRYRA